MKNEIRADYAQEVALLRLECRQRFKGDDALFERYVSASIKKAWQRARRAYGRDVPRSEFYALAAPAMERITQWDLDALSDDGRKCVEFFLALCAEGYPAGKCGAKTLHEKLGWQVKRANLAMKECREWWREVVCT